MENSFNIPIIPANEKERLEKLKSFDLLDTPREPFFDKITELAISSFKVPIALISLVADTYADVKAEVGLPGVRTVDRGISLCSLAILSDKVTVFEDAFEQKCLLNNPMVRGSFGLRFYAAAPLTTKEGLNIGAIALVDRQPRTFTADDAVKLELLSKLVMEHIYTRLMGRQPFYNGEIIKLVEDQTQLS
jgi:hypothetical protein